MNVALLCMIGKSLSLSQMFAAYCIVNLCIGQIFVLMYKGHLIYERFLTVHLMKLPVLSNTSRIFMYIITGIYPEHLEYSDFCIYSDNYLTCHFFLLFSF